MTETERPLTTKQRAVCDLIIQGLSTKQIAHQIGIGVRTVESHRIAIFEKVGVRNAVQLTRKMLLGA